MLNRSPVLIPILLALLLTLLLVLLVPFDFSGRGLKLVTSEVMGFRKEIRFVDLNGDGDSERLEFNFDESRNPFLVVMGRRSVQRQIDFRGQWFPSPAFWVEPARETGSSRFFTLLRRQDSLMLAMTDPLKDEGEVVMQHLLNLPHDFTSTDLHAEILGLTAGADGDELIINLGARWHPEGSALIGINTLTGKVNSVPVSMAFTHARLVRCQEGAPSLIIGDSHGAGPGSIRLAVWSATPGSGFEQLFTPFCPDTAATVCKSFILQGDPLRLGVITWNPDSGGDARLGIYSLKGELIFQTELEEPAEIDPLPYHRNMNYRHPTLNREEAKSHYGFSVRCVKDGEDDGRLTLTDPRDGKEYPLFRIGSFTWMAANLDWDGPFTSWDANEPGTARRYGRLYTWESAMKACPPGWHLSTDAEWQQMEVTAGMSRFAYDMGWRWFGDAGRKIQSSRGWYSDSLSNLTGFSALPAGHWEEDEGGVRNRGLHSYFWTSTRSGEWMIFDPDGDEADFHLIHSSGKVIKMRRDGSDIGREFNIPDFKVAQILHEDLDGDGTRELLYLSRQGYHMVVLNNRIKNPRILPITYSYGENRLTPVWEQGRIDRWYYQNGDKGWYFRYERHPWEWSLVIGFVVFAALFLLFWSLLGWQRKTLRRREKLERKMLELQYQGIANQFNPHLTFNLFNTVSGFLFNKQTDEALKLTNRYAQLLRRTMFNGRSFEITLREELEAVNDLLEIENICMEGNFRFRIITDPSHAELKLPRSLVFLFAENAVKHGARAQSVNPEVQVVTLMLGKELLIEVQDNGPGLNGGEKSLNNGTGSGFRIASEVIGLYETHSGRKIRFEFAPAQDITPQTFTVVRIWIPAGD